MLLLLVLVLRDLVRYLRLCSRILVCIFEEFVLVCRDLFLCDSSLRMVLCLFRVLRILRFAGVWGVFLGSLGDCSLLLGLGIMRCLVLRNLHLLGVLFCRSVLLVRWLFLGLGLFFLRHL